MAASPQESSRSRKTFLLLGEDTADTASQEDDDITEFTQLKEKPSNSRVLVTEHEGSTRKSLVILALVFLGALVMLAVVYATFPSLDEQELQLVKVPHNIEDAKSLGKLLERYNDKYYVEVLAAYLVVFIFLQTFAIPGTVFLSIISGFLYPFLLALPLVCMCSAFGASFCYLLSYMVGRRIVQQYFPERAADWKKHVDNHREHLFNYIVFLRITPFLPNWFINIVSPVIDVPIFTFFFGTLLGVAPPSFVFIQAGTTLHKMTSTTEAWSLANIGLLAVFALIAVLPVILKKQLRTKLE